MWLWHGCPFASRCWPADRHLTSTTVSSRGRRCFCWVRCLKSCVTKQLALMVHCAYQPGGAGEKAHLLHFLTAPETRTTLETTLNLARKWLRLFRRGRELAVVLPDTSLLCRGLDKLVSSIFSLGPGRCWECGSDSHLKPQCPLLGQGGTGGGGCQNSISSSGAGKGGSGATTSSAATQLLVQIRSLQRSPLQKKVAEKQRMQYERRRRTFRPRGVLRPRRLPPCLLHLLPRGTVLGMSSLRKQRKL